MRVSCGSEPLRMTPVAFIPPCLPICKATGGKPYRGAMNFPASCIGDPSLEALFSDGSRLSCQADGEARMSTVTRASRSVAAPLRMLWGVGVVGGLSDGQLL